ncbi:MAG: DUF2341 domain-containing protein [Thaumarchaeota archaeon]|nr:DUF2341 domain-containing protein [Nitrososphaerota archaeon]
MSYPVIDESIVLDAEYSEDRWKLKNRVIYVGADGEILADVSEESGDLPVVVHDPYLTDSEEAERRANIRLALNKEYGRSLRITMHQKDFKDLGVDLGDTCMINLPSVGLNGENMVLLGIEYDPKRLIYRLEFGGRKELLEDWLDEQIGGDVARRFGKAMTLPEQTSTLAYSLDKIARIQADQKHVLYVNKPPITLYNAQNVILNSNGEVELNSGATEGSFEAQVLPPSELFVNWIKSEWIAEKGEKTIPGSPEDWPSSLTDWKYRKKITIQENVGQDLTDYQIKLIIHYGSGTDLGSDIYLNEKCKSDFGDIRFTDVNGNLLAYCIEEKTDGDYAIFWVKIPSIPANGTTDIYIYYGNPDAIYDGNPEQVFELFDDFEETELDTSKWNTHLGSGGSISVSDGQLIMQEGSGGSDASTWTTIYSKQTFDNIAVKARIKFTAMENILLRMGAADEQFYVFRLDGRSGKYDVIGKYPAGATKTTELVMGSGSSPDTWYKHEARAYGSQLRQYKDDVEELSTTDATFTSGYIGVSTDGASGTVYVDWILVRKYVEPEPSISTIGDEEEYTPPQTISIGEVSAQFLNGDGESLGHVYDACDTRFYRFRKWPQGYGSFTYRNASSWGSSNASVGDKRMGILHAYCLKLVPDTLGSDGEIYYPSSKDLSLDLSWAKWLRLYLYADHESDVTIKIRLHQDADNYFEGSLVVKAKEWRKYEVSMDSLSQVGSPSLSQINWISVISPYLILMDSDHVFLPAVRELMRVKFTLKRDSPDDPSPRIKFVKIIWREGA